MIGQNSSKLAYLRTIDPIFVLAHTYVPHIQVRCILWSQDDSRLVSCSMDGAIYEWNVQACKRENENVLKGCSYTSLAITADLKTTFAVGSDRTLKEINLPESNVHRCICFLYITALNQFLYNISLLYRRIK